MRSASLALLVAVALAACRGPAPTGGPTPAPTLTPTPASAPAGPGTSPIIIDDVTRKLDWKKLSPSAFGWRLERTFQSAANSTEWVLAIEHADVEEFWKVEINSTLIGYLDAHRGRATSHLPIPAGLLVAGDNQVKVHTDSAQRPIFVHSVKVLPGTDKRAVTALGSVRVRVLDKAAGAPIPARITVTDERNDRVQMFYTEGRRTAARLGIVYVMTEPVSFQLPAGRYRLHATHGMEWSMDSAALTVEAGGDADVELAIEKVVDTAGFVAADTHLHILAFSGHGNASMEERLITLAGEGVEFAVATDHNHNTDYRPDQERLGLSEYFYSVTGNEVTTRVGHFNGFPLKPGDDLPNHYLRDWVKLVDSIRERGAEVVILNHPRWPTVNHSPFERRDLNQLTGDASSDTRITFDAMELVNTNTLIDHPLVLFADWFALLNRGERVTAVGASDSHTVEAVPGQARTYVRSRSERPGDIVESEMYQSLRKGQTTISMGIFAELRLPGGLDLGDIVPVSGRRLQVPLRVAAPEWVTPRTAFVFINGQQVARKNIAAKPGQATDEVLSFDVQTPAHDGHLVCVVLGTPPAAPVWYPVKDYALAATNPIYLDVDGDGAYSPPRATAERELARLGTDLARIEAALPKLDPAIAAQVLSLVRGRVDRLVEGQAPRHKLAVPRPHTHVHDGNEAHAH